MNHDVRPLQIALAAKGYDIGVVDGIFGTKTRAAMQDYERANKLAVSDQPTRELVASLGVQLADDFPYQQVIYKHPPNPLADAIGMFVIETVLKRLGVNMDLAKISKAIAAAIAGAGIGGGTSAYTYISLPASVAAQLPSWVSAEVPIVNAVIGAIIAFLIVYLAPANKTT